jgi:hypothetical protein
MYFGLKSHSVFYSDSQSEIPIFCIVTYLHLCPQFSGEECEPRDRKGEAYCDDEPFRSRAR